MTRVLILDDRAINRQVLTTLLSYKGFETREAIDGVEGLEIVAEWPPDLAIVDIAMPRMDGVEFVKRLHADPKHAATPIIFYTASYDPSEARRIGEANGAVQVLMKPSEPDVILRAIERALGKPHESRPSRTSALPAFDRLQIAAMRAGALIDFQLEIAAQRAAGDILKILARAARTIIASQHSIVTVGKARLTGCEHDACEGSNDGTPIRVPLETAAQRYGWLTLMDKEGGGPYDADDERIALTIAAQAAVAYENLKLYDEIRMEADLLDRNVNLLHATIEASGDGIVVVDQNARYVTLNRRYVEILRLPEEILESGDAKDSYEFMLRNVKDPVAYRAAIEAVRNGRETDHTFQMLDGRFIEGHGAPRLLNGEIIGRVWSFRDVTDRIQGETALRQSEAKYRTLVANIPDIIWTVDASGRILFMSPNVEIMTGYSAEEIMRDGQSGWVERIHAEDRLVRDSSLETMFEQYRALEVEYRFQHKDGRWIWVHASSLGAYERDGVLLADGVLRDITAQKEADETLRNVARDRALLLESTGDGIFAVDPDGICIMANRMAATLLGRSVEELTGTRIHELIRPFGTPFDVTRPVRVDDAAFFRRDGTEFPVEYIAAPIVDEGVVRGTVVSFADISERRRLEQRLEQVSRIDSLGRMAATIAHEFNNVLMGIQPFAEVIRRKGAADESLQKAAGHILNSIARGKGITQDILRMSRAAEPQIRSVEVIPWIEQLTSEIRGLVGTRVKVELDVPAWDPLFVRCDPAQMQQVLTNLAVNARDAMGGNGTLRILAERAGGMVRIVVADSGCGIPKETLPFIFEPLFTTKKSGTGLGLAVAQQIVVRNGGTIGVESEVGEGTRFTIELPQAEAPARETASAGDDHQQQLGIERILIVEDDPSVASGLAAILESEGIGVRVIERGEEAMRAVALFDPDVVLIDVSLPDMSGADVYEEIVGKYPGIGVIFSTGHADESRLPKAHSERVGFLRKPYSSETLLSKLREVM
jgi:PAS domain S-box-containing protein